MRGVIFLDDIRRAELPDHYYVDMTFDGQKKTYLFEVDDENNSVTPLDRDYDVRFHRTGRISGMVPSLVGQFHRGTPISFPVQVRG